MNNTKQWETWFLTKSLFVCNKMLIKAYLKMVEGQVQAYKMDTKQIPTSLDDLTAKDYLPAEAKCPDGTVLTINAEGKVINPKSASGTE